VKLAEIMTEDDKYKLTVSLSSSLSSLPELPGPSPPDSSSLSSSSEVTETH
jgi:hypothetical protein